MKKLTLFFAGLLVSLNGFAQLSINGVVRDSLHGIPLSFAHITVPGSYTGTFTDSEGRFRLRNLKGDRLTICVSYLGFRTVEHDIGRDTGPIEIMLSREAVLSDEVVISATRANEKHAMAYSSLDREAIDRGNYGQDMPYLLSRTPSAIATSDAGTGIGYSGIRIRGSDASRINVTVNGIPVNDAESQLVYWVDLPDLAASADNIQVQRGVGTSTNGAGAFGGSINIQTNALNEKPYVRSDHVFGSFGTAKNSVAAGTGLLHGQWTFDMRLSGIQSEGYIDRASSNLKSIFISQGFYGNKAMARLNIFSGKEITYQSWYGTPEAVIRGDVQGMIDYSIRNGLDTQDSLNLLTAGRTYNHYLYHNQVDDYRQDNYQLHLAFEPLAGLTLNTAFHYTHGKGFYEEFKKNQQLSDYGVQDSVPGFVFTDVNLIRRKWLDNDFYGIVWSLQLAPSRKWSLVMGGAWNRYLGDHLDEVIWAEFLPVESIPFGYAFDTGDKTDFNTHLRSVFDVRPKVSLLADLQVRRVNYLFSAPLANPGAAAQSDRLWFFNPKAGITIKPNETQTWYASLGVGNKEPSRNDYVNSPPGLRPVSEKLIDLEAGYTLRLQKVLAALNFYHMAYENQLVLNGSLNDVGEPLRVNVRESFRQGMELEAGIKISGKIKLEGQVTAGRSRIRQFHEIIADYDLFENDTVTYSNTNIAYSPELIARGEVQWEPLKSLTLSGVARYAGRQFLDNTSNTDRMLNAYWTSDLLAAYSFKTKVIRKIRIGIQVSNLFNNLYESNGYTYSYIYGGKTVTENFYYPQAGSSVMGRVTLDF